ncbi:hypothetical protein VTK26DRAFT_9052 [Humicola hyalothermophila]
MHMTNAYRLKNGTTLSVSTMALYATGLNAWNQFQFEGPTTEEPDDLRTFTCVLHGNAIHHVRSFLSYTFVRCENGNTLLAGMIPKGHERLRISNKQTYETFVEASNDIVVAYDGISTLHQYPSIRDLLSNRPAASFPNFPDIIQLVAYATGYAALTSTGQVWTWGDERYTPCLGREPSDESPASTPGPVPSLTDLPTGPITKLATSPGSYLLAALTAGNDLYVWGDRGRAAIFCSALSLTDMPSPVVIGVDDDDNGKDVADVAVGDAHIIALTTDGEVYVVGDNANGQLGVPGLAAASTWTRVDLGSLEGGEEQQSRVTGVAAGPRSSFLIVRNNQNQPDLTPTAGAGM